MTTLELRGRGAFALAAVVMALAMVIAAPHASAFKILQTDCGGDRFRDPGADPVFEMCLSPPGFPGMTSATDPNSNTFAAARGGMLSGYWMWVREGTSDASLFVSTFDCGDGSGFGWYDDANELNDSWWESTATVQTRCPGSTGCTATDEALCIPWVNESTHIIAADTVVSNQHTYSVVNQDTLVDCFRPGANHETLWLHEVGHAYGLGHDNAVIGVMATGNPQIRNCHVAQGFHNYPFPDDIAGLMKHHKGFSGTKRNWAGTPWSRLSGIDSFTSDSHTVTTNTKSVSVTFTVHSYYGTGASPNIRLHLVPINTPPTFNFQTKVWTLNSVQQGLLIPLSSFGIESRRVTQTATFGGSTLPVGSYRVWVMVDANNVFASETDEGDNVFPTEVMFNRTAG